MTHNFRTPLNSILGIAELILTSMIPIHEDHKEYVIKINNQSLILLDLVDNIYEYFNYKNNKLQREDEEFDPKEVIQSVFNLYQDDIKAKNISINLKIKKYPVHYILNDKKKYRQIIISLILNSIKHTNNSKIEIEIAYEKDSKILVTQIEGQGNIIPPGIANGLFQDISRIRETPMHLQDEVNLGYGIQLSQAFCTIMGGSNFDISSNENETTKIYFEIRNYSDNTSSREESSVNYDLNFCEDSHRKLESSNSKSNLSENLNHTDKIQKILIVDDENSNVLF